MKEIVIAITGEELDFQLTRALARSLAEKGNAEASLVAWFDAKAGKHSPCCLKCEIGERPGWEVYGENHGGRVKVIFNAREYVFIYS